MRSRVARARGGVYASAASAERGASRDRQGAISQERGASRDRHVAVSQERGFYRRRQYILFPCARGGTRAGVQEVTP